MNKEDFKKGIRVIDGVEIPTETKEIASACVIEVEAGTNGEHGGDTGHGGRTYFRITNLASTDMSCWVQYDSEDSAKANEVVITFGGDCELECFIKSLEFALNTLRPKSKIELIEYLRELEEKDLRELENKITEILNH